MTGAGVLERTGPINADLQAVRRDLEVVEAEFVKLRTVTREDDPLVFFEAQAALPAVVLRRLRLQADAHLAEAEHRHAREQARAAIREERHGERVRRIKALDKALGDAAKAKRAVDEFDRATSALLDGGTLPLVGWSSLDHLDEWRAHQRHEGVAL